MLELTSDECKELENRVANRFTDELSRLAALRTAHIVITTIREYERMKQGISTQEAPAHKPDE